MGGNFNWKIEIKLKVMFDENTKKNVACLPVWSLKVNIFEISTQSAVRYAYLATKKQNICGPE
jgi:hypothetical protein